MVKIKRKMRQLVLSAFLIPDSVFSHSLPLLQKAKSSDEEWKEKTEDGAKILVVSKGLY